VGLKSSLARCARKLAVFALLTSAIVQAALAQSALDAPGFAPQRRAGYTVGDQWEPAMAADGRGHIYILFPQYGPVSGCASCTVPTMALLISHDNGVSWEQPRPMLIASTGQFDAQIKVDPIDRQTLYASWLQGQHDVIVSRSQDFGRSWYFAVAQHSPEVIIDKPVLAVRGPNVYVSFNHDQTLSIAASHDYGQNFASAVVNPDAVPGWSLAAGATVDAVGNVYFSWTAYPRTNILTRPVEEFISRSADGGRNWSTMPMDVSSAAPGCLDQFCSAGFLASQMALASDDAGIIYAAWNSGSNAGGPERIYFSSSTNQGESWSAKVDVSKAPLGVEHCFPAITTGSAGDVRIAWMDARKADGQNHPLWNVFYRTSTNGGATWSPEVQLSTPVRGYDYILPDGFLFPFGNLFSIAIDNLGNTHAVWGEGRNYKSPGSIWYARGR
jgi:hypothetical protein